MPIGRPKAGPVGLCRCCLLCAAVAALASCTPAVTPASVAATVATSTAMVASFDPTVSATAEPLVTAFGTVAGGGGSAEVATTPPPRSTSTPTAAALPLPSATPTAAGDAGEGSAVIVAESPLQVMVTPTGGPTPLPTLYVVAPVLVEAAAQVYSVPSQYGHSGEVGVNTLGMAVEPAVEVALGRQWFGPVSVGGCSAADSLLLWREDSGAVALLLVGTSGDMETCYPDLWLACLTAWTPDEADEVEERPPDGYYLPAAGLRQAWQHIRQGGIARLGYATTEARRGAGTVQRFENGSAYYFSETGEVYLLFDRYRRITRAGESEARVWFRLP